MQIARFQFIYAQALLLSLQPINWGPILSRVNFFEPC